MTAMFIYLYYTKIIIKKITQLKNGHTMSNTLNEKIEKYKSQIAKLKDEIKRNNNFENQIKNKKHEIQQNISQLEEINNEKEENTIKCLEEQKHSLKEDIEHCRSNLNNKESILEHTDHSYQRNHQTQESTLLTKVNDHRSNHQQKPISVRTFLKMYRINKQIIHRIMKQ